MSTGRLPTPMQQAFLLASAVRAAHTFDEAMRQVEETMAEPRFITPSAETLGRIAYFAWRSSRDLGTEWAHLAEEVREHWRFVGLAVAREVQKADGPKPDPEGAAAMSDPEDHLAEIRERLAAMPDGPLDVDVDRDEEEYYMRWAMVRYGPPNKHGWRDWIAATNAENQGVAEFIAHAPEDITWLVGEIERLRDLLRELQWAGTHCDRDRETAACPVCETLADSPVFGQQPHAPDCWLARELRST